MNGEFKFLRPAVVVSQCLGFAAVRYNGAMLQDEFVRALQQHVEFKQVCPEIAIGLGVPRDPIRIVTAKNGKRLVQPATGRDITDLMRNFSASFLESVGEVDGFILKSRSPSCGIKDVKSFTAAENAMPMEKTTGVFAEAVLERFPEAAVEDEGRLTNLRLRHHFLVKLFASTQLRADRAVNELKDLVRFHTEYKLQFMAHSHAGLYELGRIVANRDNLPTEEIYRRYAARMGKLLANPARNASMRNVLLHAFGYVSKELTKAERTHFLELLDQYRDEQLPLSSLLVMLRSWTLRFEQPYLLRQRIFQPYPQALMQLTDSSTGRV